MKYSKFTLLIFGAICISIFFLPGCNQEQEVIKIGVVGTMTGINSDLSVSGRRGVELAVEEFNDAGGLGGRKIELVVKDDKYDAAIALQVDKEFIEEKIPVVIGHYTSGMMVDSFDYLKNKDILFLSPTMSADSLLGIDDNFIRYIGTTLEQTSIIADTASKNNHKQFAVIYNLENTGFNDAFFNNFKKLLEEDHGEVILKKIYPSINDINYSSLSKELEVAKADAILLIAGAADNALITQQLWKNGNKAQIYAPLWSNTVDLMIKGGAAIEGMLIVGAIDINGDAPDYVRFKQRFFDKYGEDFTFSAVYSYEATTSLFKAMKMGPDLKPSTLKNNIISISDYQGLDGNFQIDKFGDNIRKYMIFRIEDGQQRRVD